MDNFSVKGDEVRHGKQIYLDALSKATIESLADVALSDAMLAQLSNGNAPLTQTTARQVAQSYKEAGQLPFAVRLRVDKTCVGVCRLDDISWSARHAHLHIGIVDEAHFTVDMLADVIQTVLQFTYWEANLNRVQVACIEDNAPLCDALVQTGFTDEGRLRQEVYRNGRYRDKIVFSILRREWSPTNANSRGD